MDLGNLKLFQIAQERMDWLAQRQKVLSQNIANANTPGYAARDLVPIDFKSELSRSLSRERQKIEAARTDPRHLAGRLPKAGPYRVATEKRPFEYTLDANGVDIEEQMEKSARTKIDYDIATNLMKKNLSLIKTALGRSGD